MRDERDGDVTGTFFPPVLGQVTHIARSQKVTCLRGGMQGRRIRKVYSTLVPRQANPARSWREATCLLPSHFECLHIQVICPPGEKIELASSPDNFCTQRVFRTQGALSLELLDWELVYMVGYGEVKRVCKMLDESRKLPGW